MIMIDDEIEKSMCHLLHSVTDLMTKAAIFGVAFAYYYLTSSGLIRDSLGSF